MKKKKKDWDARPELRHDDPGNYFKVLREFLGGNDRSIAIVGAALVDDALERAIRARFVCSNTTANRLLAMEGPLGAFSARIDICSATGIVGQITYGNLRIIREIRNRFAHKMLMLGKDEHFSGITFKTPMIVKWCQSIKRIDGYLLEEDQTIEAQKTRFAQTCLVISFMILDHLGKNNGKHLDGQILP
jgi:hypothetical protein